MQPEAAEPEFELPEDLNLDGGEEGGPQQEGGEQGEEEEQVRDWAGTGCWGGARCRWLALPYAIWYATWHIVLSHEGWGAPGVACIACVGCA